MLGGIETIRVLNTVQFESRPKSRKVQEKTSQDRDQASYFIWLYMMVPSRSTEGFFHDCSDRPFDLSGIPWRYFKGDNFSYSHPVLAISRNPLLEIHRILDQASRVPLKSMISIIFSISRWTFLSLSKDTTSKVQENDNGAAVSVKKLSFFLSR